MGNDLFLANSMALTTDALLLPSEIRLERAHLRVRNIEKALDFYGTLLGLHVGTSEESSVALCSSPDGELLLLLTEDPRAEVRNHSTPGLFHMAFRFESRADLARVLKRLIENRWRIQGFADHGVSEALYLADPEGNGVELYTDKPMGRWPHMNGRLQMVTEPLDLEGLLATAANTVEATRSAVISMGHIHLQVSDLGKAERFYHGVLGLDITQRDFPGALFFSAGGYHHHIGVNTWNSRGATSSPGNNTGLIGFTMRFSDSQLAEEAATGARTGSLSVEPNANGHVLRDHDTIRIHITSH